MRYIKQVFVLGVLAASAATTYAQSAIDAYGMASSQLRGTARFVAMGGAFTSLGGDISTLGQNPAGIGVYRHSDIGLTFDISIRNYEAKTDLGKYSNSHTRGFFDNFGYVGAVKLDGALRTFNWGISYNRNAEFDRRFSGRNYPTSSSLTNYIAAFTDGTDSSDMIFDNSHNYNPYLDSNCDWLSILGYNSYMINNYRQGDNTSYSGLYQTGSEADAEYSVRESGYTDEYNIDFGGNVYDILYWGVGVGIVDMSYTRQTNYSESMSGALIYDNNGPDLTTGNAGFGLYNNKYISGTGANLKFGVIVRPIEMLRIGLAVHTPTWMHLNSIGYAETEYNYTPDGEMRPLSGSEYTDNFDYNWRLNSPWRFMAGASLVIGSSAIVSVDYERVAYNDMKVKYESFDNWGSTYVSDEGVNANVKDYFKASNIIRVGVEYRLTRSFSLRAGYNYQSSNVREGIENGSYEISTSGTDPSYTFNKATNNICVGVGYRYKSWYIDAAYQHTNRRSDYHAYTPYEGVKTTPSASITSKLNNIVITTGFRF